MRRSNTTSAFGCVAEKICTYHFWSEIWRNRQMPKPKKLTVILPPQTWDALVDWAQDEGRPVCNLIRRIVCKSLEQRQQGQQSERAVA